MKSFLFISTNGMWGGSEELWVESAKKLITQGHKVWFTSKFYHPMLFELESGRSDILGLIRGSLIKRVFRKAGFIKKGSKTRLLAFAKKNRPDLVIISQGNNILPLDVVDGCIEANIPFVTITQLVAELHYMSFTNETLHAFQIGYLSAQKNYFVSEHNLRLNDKILGIKLPNSQVIFNPCKLVNMDIPLYPKTEEGIYTVGLVGRLECYHKGYDLLIEVIAETKWKSRNIHFNIYGKGPHELLIKETIKRFGIRNLFLKGHTNNVIDIWKENQILALPSRIEGQSLTLIEAMWCNRAAIVTDVGGATELVNDGKNGFVAEAPTVNILGEILEKAWQERHRWKEMGDKAGKDIRLKYPEDTIEYFNKKLMEVLS